jgi:hypothetical protein
MAKYEVQTCIGDGWENCWHVDDEPAYYDTHDEAMAAIYEFFADLSRAGMAQGYLLEDYRVRPVKDAV